MKPLLLPPALLPAALAGRLSQLWMPMKVQPCQPPVKADWTADKSGGNTWTDKDNIFKCLYPVGTRLFVKEAFACRIDIDGNSEPARARHYTRYKADGGEFSPSDEMNWHDWGGKWRPACSMPEWAARLRYDVVSVDVRRVQSVSEADALAAGLEYRDGDGTGPGAGYKWHGRGYHGGTTGRFGKCYHTPGKDGRCSCNVGGNSPAQCAFAEVFDRLHGPGSYEANLWCWVYGLKGVV